MLLECWPCPADPRLVHTATPSVRVVAATAVQQTAVVPNDGIANLPLVRVDILWAGGAVKQVVDEFPALDTRPANDGTRMRTDIEILAAIARVCSYQLVLDGR